MRAKAFAVTAALTVATATSAVIAQPSQAFANELEVIPANRPTASIDDTSNAQASLVSPRTSGKISQAIDMTQLCNMLDAKISTSKADVLIAKAMSLQGTPYVYGGTTPRGFDCSGFVLYCMQESLGIEMPRTAASQSTLGTSVSLDELEPGDLVFWGRGGGVNHVGIYVGDGNYIHSPQTGKTVCVQPLAERMPSFAKRIL